MNQGIESRRRLHARRYAEKQARLIEAAENPGEELVPIRTPTVVFCKNPMCLKKIRIVDTDVKTKDFIKCPLCGTPYPLWVRPAHSDRRRGPRN